MKIRINKSETYVVELPEEINSGEFHAFLDRLTQISKLIVKDAFKTLPLPKKTNNDSTPTHSEVIEILKEKYGEGNYGKKEYDKERYEVLKNNPSVKRRKYDRPKTVHLTREKIIELMKIHYKYTRFDDKEREMHKIVPNLKIKTFLSATTLYKRKFNIRPKEVGIKRWLKLGESITHLERI